MIEAQFIDGRVLMEHAVVGDEYLIRVRVAELMNVGVEITKFGDSEPLVMPMVMKARLLPLSVRASNRESKS